MPVEHSVVITEISNITVSRLDPNAYDLWQSLNHWIPRTVKFE